MCNTCVTLKSEIDRLRSKIDCFYKNAVDVERQEEEIKELRIDLVFERSVWIRAFAFFLNNYPNNFIQEVWEKEGKIMVDHFQKKWNFLGTNEHYSPAELVLYLYYDLDDCNKEILENYIVKWWKKINIEKKGQ